MSLALILVFLLVGHFVVYRLENPPLPNSCGNRDTRPPPVLAAFHEDEAAVFPSWLACPDTEAGAHLERIAGE